MNRLTKTVNGVVTYIGTGNEFDTGMLPAELSSGQIRALLIRLAAYEDTGVEPEEIADAVTAAKLMARSKIVSCFGVDADHIRDLLQAEHDGRLVVLPCKVGDTVWFVRRFGKSQCITKSEVHCINIDSRGKVFVSARRISGGYIGKTVFLTREEAEAALKGGEG